MDKQAGTAANKRMGMLIDLRKCYGCHSCTVACSQEHRLPAGVSRNRIVTVGPIGEYPDLSMHFVPQVCAQCEDPRCRSACPTGAITKDPATGIVRIQEDKCTGCSICTMACPYGAIDFDMERGLPQKCDLCADRLEQGVLPSCVVSCVGRARLVGDLADSQSQIARVLAEAGSENSFVPLPELGDAAALYYIKPDATSPPVMATTIFDPDGDLSAILPSLVSPVDEQAGESVVKSLCRGCHGVCGVRILVKDGKVVKVEGDPELPTSFGTLCPKGLAATQHLYNSDRLLYPVKRAGERGEGKWERITWDEALDTIAAKLADIREKYGPEYVAMANGTGRTWNGFGGRFFNAFGTATRLPTSPLCYWPRIGISKPTVGYKIPICDYYGFGGVYPGCVLVWGNNNVAANADGMAGARLLDTINRGARLIVIDPVFTNLAARADVWLPVRPASDGALALAILNVIVTEGLFDREFVEKWTNGSFLVREDTRQLLTERDVSAEGSAERWLVWDRSKQAVAPADGPGVSPDLDATTVVTLADGSRVACHTAWESLRRRLAEYTPEAAEAITWVPADRIRQAARIFATTRPAAIQWGVALDHQGVNSTRTTLAVMTLMAITGNLDVPGGMAFWVGGDWINGGSPEHALPKLVPQRSRDFLRSYGPSEFPLMTQACHGSIVNEAVARGELPLQALIAIGINPIVGVENSGQVYQALMKIPFIVSFDLYMTPSAELADIVLPVCTWLERDQIGDEQHFEWGIFARQQAVQPLGESRSDEEILMELGKRLGLQEHFPWKDMPEYLDWRLHRTGVNWEGFKKVGILKGPMRYKKYETDFYRPGGGFATRSGKVEIFSNAFAAAGADPLPFYDEPPVETLQNEALAAAYPLLCTNRRSAYFFHTEFRQVPWLRALEPDPLVEINPATAMDLGIRDGEWVYIETPRGRIRQRARLTNGVHPRVICARHGWWFPERSAGDDLHGAWESNLNVITRNDRAQGFDPLGGCPQLRGFLCRVRKAD